MTNITKRWVMKPTSLENTIEFQEELGLSAFFCRLLLQRGVKTKTEAHNFLHPSLDQLHDPFLMLGMTIAVERIKKAIANQEQILLYGDYDVDGTTAVALLHHFLHQQSADLDYYIPDRDTEGYGVSASGINYAKSQKIKLMITLDCGIKAVEQIARAKDAGIEVIICDHHLPEEKLPPALAILNPKQKDCSYPYKELSGCGIAFKLAQAYAQVQQIPFEEISPLLDLLAVSIAADIVPMTGENRILATFGLQQLNDSPRPGMEALIRHSKRPRPLTIRDVVYGIGPMINAAGRLTHADAAVSLLMTQDVVIAEKGAKLLAQLNLKRQSIDKRLTHEAYKDWEATRNWQELQSIVLYNPYWHKGVVGITASRMVERYNCPAVILTESQGNLVGSARSIPGINIHDALGECSDLLLNFGGHDYAAGLTLPVENLKLFRDRLEEVISRKRSEMPTEPEIQVTAEISLTEISDDFWDTLQLFAPFGPENRNPVLMSRGVEDTGSSKVLQNRHLKLMVTQDGSPAINGIAFGMGGHLLRVQREPFDICYNVQENHWQGNRSLQLQVKDLKFD